METHRIFITRKIPTEGIIPLEKSFHVETSPFDRPLTRSELLEAVKEKDGVIGMLTDRIDDEFFETAQNIRGYANYAVGYDNIDLAAATRRGIPVSNTPDVLTNATAELAWALLFAIARRVTETDRILRAGKWDGWGPMQFIGSDISGKTLGIVGAGRIGTAMAKMSSGFRMKMLYFNRSQNRYLEKNLGAQKVEFEELIRNADFISIHLPLKPETRHLFNKSTFRKMKPAAYLVNTSRGPVIKESDLVWALERGEIAGAALDVYEFEPDMAKGLSRLENVVTVPHIGSATPSARIGMAALCAENLLAFLSGKPGPTCLNPEVFQKLK